MTEAFSRFLGVVLISLSLMTPSFFSNDVAKTLRSTGKASYTISEKFTKEERALIEHAIAYFSQTLGCAKFVKADGKSRLPTLQIKKLTQKKDNYIGTFDIDHDVIKLWTGGTKKKLYKCVLHELAHASGMRGHAFSKRLQNRSQLTPIISDKSKPLLYQRDVSYLKGIVCKAPL